MGTLGWGSERNDEGKGSTVGDGGPETNRKREKYDLYNPGTVRR